MISKIYSLLTTPLPNTTRYNIGHVIALFFCIIGSTSLIVSVAYSGNKGYYGNIAPTGAFLWPSLYLIISSIPLYIWSTNININRFCAMKVPDFTPLGGSRPDAAVVACVAVWEQEEEEAKEDVILPPDVLDTTLGMLCAPPIIQHVNDLRGREAHFMCHTATIRLCTTDYKVEEALKRMTNHMPRGGLSVTMVLGEAITDLTIRFMCGDNFGVQDWHVLGRMNLRRTSLRRIGFHFLSDCRSVTSVTLPPSLTAVREGFLMGCHNLHSVDMGHTALHTVGKSFAMSCYSLTTVVLPDTVTEVGKDFLKGCGRVEVTSGSTAVQAAAAEHNKYIVARNDDGG